MITAVTALIVALGVLVIAYKIVEFIVGKLPIKTPVAEIIDIGFAVGGILIVLKFILSLF